jgi:cytoskeletal protein RodZ
VKARFNQIGSVASFIIIGVVLVLVTTGILYWAQHKDAPAAREETPVVTTPETEEATPKEEKNTDNEEASPPATSSEPAATPEPTPEVAPTVTTLSQTGPADTAFQVMALGALAVTIAGFVRSRKLRSSL